MERLFYSPTEKILFNIPDYYIDSNSCVEDFVNSLKKERLILMNVCLKNTETSIREVKSVFIGDSRRYKYMRVFYIENVETCPEQAYSLGIEQGWTMWKWLNN